MSEIQAELHEYLKEKNLNALFVSIVEAILIDKPENPIGFMTNFLLKKYPEETKELHDKLTEEKPPSLFVVAKKCSSNEELSDTGSDCSSVNTNESVVASTRHDYPSSSEKPPLKKKRRESVCAEKITEDVVEESELKVIEKTQNEAARILQILKSNVFFSHLDEHQMQTIQNVMFNVEKSDGDVIISQGDDGDNFYIIDSGTVEVFIQSSDTSERNLVKTCEAGDAFGELAIMYNAPRAASCISKGDVRLWALDRVSFNVILMKTTMAKRKSMTNILFKIPVFSQLTEYELLTIADTLQEETFKDKDIICNQGDTRCDRFYLVSEGTAVCTVSQDDETIVDVARLSSGSYFGEIALLTTKPRQATVTAEGNLKCLTMTRRTFNRVMGPLQDILMRNIEEYNKIRESLLAHI
ncbi:hypothetical protein ACHAXR_009650 [Thalassiosira sp. AJA248-18]